ncbi:MAG TPA: glycosyltransferase family 4 protein [Vicinamibacterales bacterium]|nr:glycosyltransferase family 4 protein [Vicinamibacterales bacterium]
MVHQILASHLVGGAAAVALRLAASARARGIACVGWVPGIGPASEALDAAAIPRRTYDLAAMRQGRWRQLVACARMMPGLIGTGRPVVHVHNPIVYRLLYPALRAAGARTVVHVQIEPAPGELEWALRFPPDHVVACARYIARRIERTMSPIAPALRVTAVPNAIDVTEFSSASGSRPAPMRARGRVVVLMLANLAPHKGQATALRAVHRLRQQGVQAECWLAGEDRAAAGYERELRALAAALGLDGVRFLGFRSDTQELLRAADVLLLPSTREGLPLAVLEAQAAGVPVVASPLPGILEAVADGITGVIVPADDDEGYARAILRLIADNDLRGRIVEAARASVAREYGWAAFEQRIFDIYRSLSAASARGTCRQPGGTPARVSGTGTSA